MANFASTNPAYSEANCRRSSHVVILPRISAAPNRPLHHPPPPHHHHHHHPSPRPSPPQTPPSFLLPPTPPQSPGGGPPSEMTPMMVQWQRCQMELDRMTSLTDMRRVTMMFRHQDEIQQQQQQRRGGAGCFGQAKPILLRAHRYEFDDVASASANPLQFGPAVSTSDPVNPLEGFLSTLDRQCEIVKSLVGNLAQVDHGLKHLADHRRKLLGSVDIYLNLQQNKAVVGRPLPSPIEIRNAEGRIRGELAKIAELIHGLNTQLDRMM